MLSKNLFRVGRSITRTKYDSVIVDTPIDIPTGKSDMGMKSRVSFLSQEMSDESRTGIQGLTCNGFRMYDSSFLYGPIAVFPNIALSWRVPKVEDITPESLKLFFMLQPKLDILVIGVGARKNIDKVRKQVAKAISDQRIGYEIAPTEDAIPTFNFLNAEYRCVAGCFFPDEDLKVSRGQAAKSMALINKNYDRVLEFPFNEFMPHKDLIDRALERIYGANTNEKLEAREVIEKIRQQDLKTKLEKMREMNLRIEEMSQQRRIGTPDSKAPLEVTEFGPEIPLRLDMDKPKEDDKKPKKTSEQNKPDKETKKPDDYKIVQSKNKSKQDAPKKDAPKAPQKSDKKGPPRDIKDRGDAPEPDMTDSEAFVKADRDEIKNNPSHNKQSPKPQMTDSEAHVKADRNEAVPKHTGNMETPKPQMTDSEAVVKAARDEFKHLPEGGTKKDI